MTIWATFNLKTSILVSAILVGTSLLTVNYAQTPKWIYRPPQSESGKFNYILGQGNTREDAYFDAIRTLMMQRGTISVETIAKREVEIKDEIRKSGFTTQTSVEVDKVKLSVFPVDQYFDNSLYYVLIGSPKAGIEIGGSIKTSQFVWRSALVPGWGQFYNKQKIKGLTFSIGQAVLLGSTLFAYGQANAQQDKASLALRSGSLAQFSQYDQNRKAWNTTGTILGIGAAAYWILNIVDATSSDKNRYALHTDRKLQFMATNNGIGLRWNI